MRLAVVFWCFTFLVKGLASSGTYTVTRELHQDPSQHRHRITQKHSGKKTSLPVPTIFDTDYGPFIDDGMFIVTLTLNSFYIRRSSSNFNSVSFLVPSFA